MASKHLLHLNTAPGYRRGLTVDDVAADIVVKEEDGPARKYGVIHLDLGDDRWSIFVDHGQVHAIAAAIASDLLAALPVIGDPA